MGRGSGNSRNSSASSSSSRTSGGGGNTSSKDFNAKSLSSFSKDTYGSGSVYTLSSKDGSSMKIDTEHGYNEELGRNGTSVTVSVKDSNGKSHVVANDFVDSYNSRLEGRVSGNNYAAYSNSTVESFINRMMPYYSELANNAKKRR